MGSNHLAQKPFELLGMMSREAFDQAEAGLVVDDAPVSQEAATMYIKIMYYSALSNLYVQSILPDTLKAMEGDVPPRLATTLRRSYADYTHAADWLAKNGGEFIATSPAKLYYDEVLELPAGIIVDLETFLATNK